MISAQHKIYTVCLKQQPSILIGENNRIKEKLTAGRARERIIGGS
jgi:hypothetical protein